jgi:light-regulated signal transduction histidine kinase (bacteriophytochrome)
VHIVSHDLKAPLRAVSNLSQWIEEDLEGSLTDETQQKMNLLRARLNQMSATIDRLLDYARIGGTEESIEPVAVTKMIIETLETLSPPPIPPTIGQELHQNNMIGCLKSSKQ